MDTHNILPFSEGNILDWHYTISTTQHPTKWIGTAYNKHGNHIETDLYDYFENAKEEVIKKIYEFKQ